MNCDGGDCYEVAKDKALAFIYVGLSEEMDYVIKHYSCRCRYECIDLPEHMSTNNSYETPLEIS